MLLNTAEGVLLMPAKKSKLPRGVYEKVPGSKDYWIRYADPNGTIRRQHVGRSLSAAKELVEQRRTEVRLGRFDPNSVGRHRRQSMTVREMFQEYLPLRSVKNKGEDQRYAAYWSELFGGLQLDELTPTDLERWRQQRLQKVKPATVNRAMEYLKAFYNLALRDERCRSNPVIKVALLEENNERHRWLLPEEEERLKAVLSAEDFDLVLFAIHTGLRQGEQFKLAWRDVDLDRRTLRLPETKAGKHRFVHLNQEALDVLRRQRERGADSDSPWVFPGVRRKQCPRDAHNFCQRVFQPALVAAKIADMVWHDLRHTFGSRLAINGFSLHTIGTLMGHATPTMTKRYSHLSATHLQEAVDSLMRKPVAPLLAPGEMPLAFAKN